MVFVEAVWHAGTCGYRGTVNTIVESIYIIVKWICVARMVCEIISSMRY